MRNSSQMTIGKTYPRLDLGQVVPSRMIPVQDEDAHDDVLYPDNFDGLIFGNLNFWANFF